MSSNLPVPGSGKGLYIHPHLTQTSHPDRGRQVVVSAPVSAGAILIADPPYALVPMVEPSSDEALICSNILCSNRVPQNTGECHCSNLCAKEVVWCCQKCQIEDTHRHNYECAWLKCYSTAIRRKEGEFCFSILWLTVRVMAAKHLERRHSTESTQLQQRQLLEGDNFPQGWESVRLLRSNCETWPPERIQYWKEMISQYLSDPIMLKNWAPNDILVLICQEETNLFGLFPLVNGVYPLPDAPVGRGNPYGLGIYALAAILNHSCCPNVTDQADDHGRFLLIAQKDIAAGEECMISYLDLARHVDIDARKRLLQKKYHFDCNCQRCTEEGQK